MALPPSVPRHTQQPLDWLADKARDGSAEVTVAEVINSAALNNAMAPATAQRRCRIHRIFRIADSLLARCRLIAARA
ncbi:MAG TPA: hypothetical protein VL049_18685 [Candidatus Dormibacteraeota bacterium]|nr:hypothetical protein [Candidatus Dormibacteraeota bacterium]